MWLVNLESYKSALGSARNELGQLADQRDGIDRRMNQLKKIIESLLPLVEDEATEDQGASPALGGEATDSDLGITAAIRRVFMVYHKETLTPLEVREALRRLGWDLTRHTNPMATIHSVLKRLAEQRELVAIDKGGKPAYITYAEALNRTLAGNSATQGSAGKRRELTWGETLEALNMFMGFVPIEEESDDGQLLSKTGAGGRYPTASKYARQRLEDHEKGKAASASRDFAKDVNEALVTGKPVVVKRKA